MEGVGNRFIPLALEEGQACWSHFVLVLSVEIQRLECAIHQRMAMEERQQINVTLVTQADHTMTEIFCLFSGIFFSIDSYHHQIVTNRILKRGTGIIQEMGSEESNQIKQSLIGF